MATAKKKSELPKADGFAEVDVALASSNPGFPDSARKRGSRRVEAELTRDTDYVNEQLNRVLFALDAFKKGDVSVRLTKQNDDIFSEIAEAYNSMVEMIGGVGGEVSRISKVAGVEGNLKAPQPMAQRASGATCSIISTVLSIASRCRCSK